MIKEWTCSEYTNRFTFLLAESRESVIMHSMSILVFLVIPSLIANSLASKAVV